MKNCFSQKFKVIVRIIIRTLNYIEVTNRICEFFSPPTQLVLHVVMPLFTYFDVPSLVYKRYISNC